MVTVPLSQLLANSELGLRRLAGPTEGVAISWTHVIELADPTPWLGGGELVLTVGLRLPRSTTGIEEYVERLTGRGIAALAFGAGVHHPKTPAALIRACERHGLPLVEVPLPTPFIAISRTVADLLAERQLDRLRRMVEHQKRATWAALRLGATGVVEVLRRELAVEVVLLDEQGGVVVQTSERLLAAIRRRDDLSMAGRRIGDLIIEAEDGEVVEAQSIPGRRTGRGTLAVSSDTQLTSDERVLLNQAVSLISLLMGRQDELIDGRREVAAIALDVILSDPSAAGILLSRFGFRPNESIRVLWVEPTRNAPAVLVARALGDMGRPHLAAERADGMAVLVPATDAERTARELADRVDCERSDAAIGIGRACRPEEMTQALDSAREACRAGGRDGGIARFEDLTLRAVLRDDTVRERLRLLVPSALTGLLESTSSRDRELIASLAAYLQHNGAADPAARARGIHRHTLRGHVQRVEQLTALDFDDAETRTMTHLALLARQASIPNIHKQVRGKDGV